MMKANVQLEKDDHRNYNKNGDAFNLGNTFAGLQFEKDVELSKQLRWISENQGKHDKRCPSMDFGSRSSFDGDPDINNVKQVKGNLASVDVRNGEAKDIYWQEFQSRLGNLCIIINYC